MPGPATHSLAVLTDAEVRVAQDVLDEALGAHGRTLPAVEDLDTETTARAADIVAERLAIFEKARKAAPR